MSRFGFMGILVVLFQSTTEKLHVNKAPLSRPSYEGGLCHLTKEVEEDGDNDDDNGAEDLEDDDEEEEDIEDDDEDSEDDVAREETEEEFLKRYALVAAGESIEIVEEGDIDEETQDIELEQIQILWKKGIQQVVLSLMQNQPALQVQTENTREIYVVDDK